MEQVVPYIHLSHLRSQGHPWVHRIEERIMNEIKLAASACEVMSNRKYIYAFCENPTIVYNIVMKHLLILLPFLYFTEV